MSDREDPRDRDVYVGITRGGRSRRYRLLAGTMLSSRSAGQSVRLFMGIVLVLFGLLWTLDNLGWTQAGEVLHWWPVLLLVYGWLRLTGAGMPRSTLQGVFFTGFGLLLVLARLAHLHVGLGVLFPLLTIFAGVSFVRRAIRGEAPVQSGESSEENIRLTAIMGAATSRGLGTAVRRGELCAVMGAIELDLREARPAEGRMDLEVCACMGGIEIVVPETWRVESEIVPIVGGFEDQTQRPGDYAPECTLVLRGTAIMGGVVTRNIPSGNLHIRRTRTTRHGEVVREVHITPGGVSVTRREAPRAGEAGEGGEGTRPPVGPKPADTI